MPTIADVKGPGGNIVAQYPKRKRPPYGWSRVPGGKRVRLSRKPTPLEVQLLSLEDIPDRLDAEMQQLVDALVLLRRDMLLSKERVDSPDAIEAVRRLLVQSQVSVASYGAFEHRQEWSRQGVVLSLSDDAVGLRPAVIASGHMKTLAEMRAQRLSTEWHHTLRELKTGYLRARRRVDDEDWERFVERWLLSGVKDVARQTVNSSFNFGRAEARRQLIELRTIEPETMVYTAIMDANTCGECEDKDGREFEEDSDDAIRFAVPSPECLGGIDRCRCIWVAIGSEPGWVDARREHGRLIGELRLRREMHLSDDWDESMHPRDENGRFAEVPGNQGSEGFMREMDANPVNPFNDRERLLSPNGDWRSAFAVVETSAVADDRVRLHFVKSVQPGTGQGRRAMELLVGLADKHNVTLEGTAKPVGSGGLNRKQLFAFYEKFGFSVNKRSGDMERRPRRAS